MQVESVRINLNNSTHIMGYATIHSSAVFAEKIMGRIAPEKCEGIAVNVDKIIDIAIGGLFVALFIPFAITEIVGTDTSGWSAVPMLGTLWEFLPVILLVVVVLLILNWRRKQSGKGKG